jgi:HNH endonuclease/AP2 domain
MIELTAERLREILDYHPESGIFYWRIARRNGTRAGNIAGAKKAGGYIKISIDGRQHLAHRLAWLYVHGRWPAALIDHINGNPADNRIANLREASRSQNQANSGLRLGNRSGLKGISRKPYGTWSAQIFYQGTKHYLGTFATPEEAHAAYREAARRLFGEFARMP